MEAAAHAQHEHHEMPTAGRALSVVALSATLHCLTGCAIGEVLGMIIGTALGFSDLGTIALAVALAFLFGYSLTSLPLLRAGLALGAVIPIAFASDTLSIAVMEIVDNVIMVVVPGAMEVGVGDMLFWGALSVALVIAGVFAFPVNRWLIARGKGHTAVHETGIHGGPPVKLVGAVTVVAAIFGTTVLLAEAFSDEGEGHGGERAAQSEQAAGGHGGSTGAAAEEGAPREPVGGLAVNSNGMTLELASDELPVAHRSELRFRIVGSDGGPVRDYEIEQEKRMHLIVVRRDMTGFQHLHPKLGSDGSWSTPMTLAEAGSYRVFADFMREGEKQTLAADLAVDGPVDWRPLPPPSATAKTGSGYEVKLDAAGSQAGKETALSFSVSRGGKTLKTEPYLGAGGHLVALREGDLAYLHVHPTEAARGKAVKFETEFPTAGAYRLFLQFKHRGRVHTAAFTRQAETFVVTSEMGKPPAEQEGGHHGE
jgi:uncharacterized protein DUF4396